MKSENESFYPNGSSILIKKFMKFFFNIRDDLSIENERAFKVSADPLSSEDEINTEKGGFATTDEESRQYTVDVDALFYSLLFQIDGERTDGMANNFEKDVTRTIDDALAKPQNIADSVLHFPSRLIEINQHLEDPDSGTGHLLQLLQQDPVLTVEVLKLCNSSTFKNSDIEITSLQDAIVQLGRDQLRRLVSSCMVREPMDIKLIYFRRFGAQIWRHSLQVAYLAGELAEDDIADNAFLIGLIHDVGKIAIFKMLLEAFTKAEPGEQPSSILFHQIMTARSLTLSALLSKHWGLPESITATLSLLAEDPSQPESGIAKIIWRANMISEISMLEEAGKLKTELMDTLLWQVGLTPDEFKDLHEKLKNISEK